MESFINENGTKHIVETAEFGSKKELIKVLGYKDAGEIDGIESYVWGYNLAYRNIVAGSVKTRCGIHIDETFGIITMPYEMLLSNETICETVEYDIKEEQ